MTNTENYIGQGREGKLIRTKQKARLQILLITLLLLVTPNTYTFATNDQEQSLDNGMYSIKLNFLIADNQLFYKEATLIVEGIKNTIILTVKEEVPAHPLAIAQQEQSLQYEVDETKKNITVPSIDLQTALTINGFLNNEEQELFTEIITIHVDGEEDTELDKPLQEEPGKPEEQPTEKPEEGLGSEKPEQGQQESNEATEKKIPFTLVVDGTKEPSIMNTYVDPYVVIREVDGNHIVRMKIIQSSWVVDLLVEQNSEMIKPKIISEKNNERIIEFTMQNLKKRLTLSVHVVVPKINYDHQYDVQFMLDYKVVEEQFGQEVNIELEEEKEEGQEDGTEQGGQFLPSAPPLSHSLQLPKSSERVGGSPQQVLHRPSTTPKEKQQIPTLHKAGQVEEALRFDRHLDGREEVMEVPEMDSEVPMKKKVPVASENAFATSDKVKLSLLVVFALFSGYLLLKRLRKQREE